RSGARGRRRAHRRGEERGSRRAPGDRRCRALGALRRRAGRGRCAGRAGRAEPGLRGEVRLPLRRLRRPPAEERARADRPRAPAADARAGARDRARRAGRDRGRPVAALLGVSDYWWDWGNLLLRWLHVIAAMAWIGASFYFIALDNHLRPVAERDDLAGESWEVHGGGFYRIEKFRVAPARLPEPLHWFKWEAYTTWLSGFALFIVVYYVHASTFLVDPSVRDLSTWEAISLSIAGLVL